VRLDERKLVEHVEMMVDNPVLGPALLEADYDNYKDPDLSDIPFPFHIVQKFRGSPILDITLTGARMYNPYVVVPTPDNVEQAYAANAADPQSTVEMQKAGPGVWFITGASHNSLAVEFKDYIAVIESPVGDNRAIPTFEAVRKQFPNKKIRYVINTHNHFDHLGGLRTYVAEGATVIAEEKNKDFYKNVVLAPQSRTLLPDRLSQRPFAPTGPGQLMLQTFTDSYTISDGNQTIELYHVESLNHSDNMLIAYLPQSKILINADMYAPPAAGASLPFVGEGAIALFYNIFWYSLDVAQHVPIRGNPGSHTGFEEIVGPALEPTRPFWCQGRPCPPPRTP